MTEYSQAVPTWAYHRRLYNWILSLAHHPHATFCLALLSLAESSVFPIAPDILMIALALERRSMTWVYAIITTISSVVGGVIGYFIGAVLWEHFSSFFFHYVFSEALFWKVSLLYHEWGFWAIFVAAFTPIPYKVFTVSAGVFQISFPLFVIASIIGRGARFFLVAALLWYYGPSTKKFIDKYFNLLSIAFVVILLGGFYILTPQ